MKLKKLLEGTGARIDSRLSEINITSVSTNSKNVKNASLFIAIEGLEFDGHKFVDEAFKKGSRTFIVDKRKKTYFPKGNVIKVEDTRKALIR